MTPRVVDKQARRLALVEAAARIFARKGYQGARIADVATEAGLGKGTVYEYFPSKEELFFAVFAWSSQRMEAQIEAEIGELQGAGERLRAMGREAARQGLEYIDIYGLTLEFWAAAGTGACAERFRNAFRELYRELRVLVQGVIESGQVTGELREDLPAEQLAGALVGALDFLMLQHWLDRSQDPLAATDAFLDTLIRGMVADRMNRPGSTSGSQPI